MFLAIWFCSSSVITVWVVLLWKTIVGVTDDRDETLRNDKR